ncbi:MAG: exonuclease SbcCD subunit D C-terminal domain-containing protein [Nitrospirae bacterium]|uniref:exonuclease SbcCD subunit D C-terminal domain-containing protein n=1 Tax=Candidatus Magnetobacterium casense TaxID=1455061 RepID=UPI00058D9819|nr:exonuclease SbcCD subunit D C-terminal domain-containing protein [Candidatus Magnetobacterium casensis]MBF0337006.1 exonuclease SbcCD subunit D C-terminal domain-containing protein [Nitrospirota bacterium]
MKIIHTSDWHIGHSLYGRKRYEEFEAFFRWFAGLIEDERVDVLLVAGDVFDNSAPSHRAQELYYRFLWSVARSGCSHVVITGGNHDSASFLNAPGELLRALNIHVVGCIGESEEVESEVLTLSDVGGRAGLIVCAVPYLRDRDVRRVDAGESLQDKQLKLVEGIVAHYHRVCQRALQIRDNLRADIPIVAMGHLFTAGGRCVDGDGVRQTYVGSLAHVGWEAFPDCIDYLALGHLHVPQTVGKSETRRYCGSPLPMGFGSAMQENYVLSIETEPRPMQVIPIPVPKFQYMESICGNWRDISRRLEQLKVNHSKAWLEIVCEGDELISDLRQRLERAVEETDLEILRIKNYRMMERIIKSMSVDETMDDLDEGDIFNRCLEAHNIPPIQRQELLATYREAVLVTREDDRMSQ